MNVSLEMPWRISLFVSDVSLFKLLESSSEFKLSSHVLCLVEDSILYVVQRVNLVSTVHTFCVLFAMQIV